MITSAVTPAMVPPAVHDFSVSCTLMFAYLDTTQKPESLGSERPTPPAQIASPTRIGDTPILAATGPSMVDVVTSATVVEPREERSIWLRTNPRTISGIFTFVNISTR